MNPRSIRTRSPRIVAAALAVALSVVLTACAGADGSPADNLLTSTISAPTAASTVGTTQDVAAPSPATLATASAAATSSATPSAAVADDVQAAPDQQATVTAQPDVEQEAAAEAEAQAQNAAVETGRAAEQDAADRQTAAAQEQFDAALASGRCTDAPTERVTECVGLAEDGAGGSQPSGAELADGWDGTGVRGWYDSRGWVSEETAARAVAAGIPVGGDVPDDLRCGTLCGESPTSGEIQSQDAGGLEESGDGTGSGG